MKEYLFHTFDRNNPNLVSIIDELPLWSAPFGLELLQVVRLKRGITVLDIGSGLGFPMIELAMRLGNSSTVFGLDPWDAANERVNSKIKELNLRNVFVTKGVAEKMPFPDGYFDLLVSNNGLNNVENIRDSLAECSRVSKQGAQFVLSYNTEHTMMEFYRIFETVLRENGLQAELRNMRSHIHSKRKPLSEMKSLLQEAQFEIREVRQRSFTMHFLDGDTLFNHYLIKYWFLHAWKQIVKEEDLERIFDKVETRINEISEKEGSFTLTVPYKVIDCRRY